MNLVDVYHEKNRFTSLNFPNTSKAPPRRKTIFIIFLDYISVYIPPVKPLSLVG